MGKRQTEIERGTERLTVKEINCKSDAEEERGKEIDGERKGERSTEKETQRERGRERYLRGGEIDVDGDGHGHRGVALFFLSDSATQKGEKRDREIKREIDLSPSFMFADSQVPSRPGSDPT